MPVRFVLDSSALAKTFLEEPESGALRGWLRARLGAGDAVLAPSLVVYEVGEIVRQKRRAPLEQRRRLVKAAAGLVQLVSHDAILGNVFEYTDGLTFYDATFTALAKTADAVLVTYDQALLVACRKAGIALLSPGMS